MATILLFAGTTPGAVGMDFLRRHKLELDRQIRLLSHTASAKLRQQLTALQTNLQTVALDVDATHAYICHLPLDDSVSQWQPGDFLHCPMPHADLLQSIESGRQPGRYENFNPHAIRALRAGVHASGGTRPNGYAAVKANWEAIEERIRQCFRRTLLERSSPATNGNEPLRVILVASTFGGFASGSLEPLKQLVWDIADRMRIEIRFICILMIPGGTNVSKDSSNSRAVTAAVMKELVAISSGQHHHRQRIPGHDRLQAVPSRHVETILISDTNHAKEAQGLSICNFVSLVSELMLTLIATPLGARLTTQAADFVMRSAETTTMGEPRFATSAGLSTIYLGRERLGKFGELTLGRALLHQLLTPLEETRVQQYAQAFVVQQRLLAGQGEHQLLDRLLEEPTETGSLMSTTRLMGLIDHYTQELKDTALLIQTEAQAQLAFQQALQPAENLNSVLEQRKADFVRTCTLALQQRINDDLQDPVRGLTGTGQFLETLLELLEHIRAEAGEDIPRYEDELAQCQEWLDSFQAQIPQYLLHFKRQRQSLSYHLFSSGRIETNIAAETQRLGRIYIDAQKSYYRTFIRNVAHHVSVETLGQLQQAVRQLLTQVHQAESVVVDLQTQLQQERIHVATYRPEFECPNGLCLIETEADLQTYYQRILPEEGEDRAIVITSNRLLQSNHLLEFLSDVDRFKPQLLAQARLTLQQKLSGLHVVSELRQRFSDEQELGEVLRQRDRQSFEFIQLKGNCDKEHGVFVIRLLGLDQAQAGNLPQLLNQYSSRSAYEVMDTADPDKIIFLQYRAVFPYSDWAHFPSAIDDYRHISQATSFEKFHPVVGSRYLPFPGECPTRVQIDLAVIHAWILERIQPHPTTSGYLLHVAQQVVPLEQIGSVLCGREGYRSLVDLTSHFNCLYQAHPQRIYDQLKHLQTVRDGQVDARNPIEETVASYLHDEVNHVLLQQLNGWQSNTIAAAMES